ncbi:hypothetical protein B0H17DRAFT_1178782 [Mycena rosella]|uniref:Uncharacterized protein n=1 Tax=Mycena rosella TaxID=1033263 RepID=A0AAD7DLX9_MYCRO|nr:hypothetical protein B0H17DRAFT_1178782 [Mycena rosella]
MDLDRTPTPTQRSEVGTDSNENTSLMDLDRTPAPIQHSELVVLMDWQTVSDQLESVSDSERATVTVPEKKLHTKFLGFPVTERWFAAVDLAHYYSAKKRNKTKKVFLPRNPSPTMKARLAWYQGEKEGGDLRGIRARKRFHLVAIAYRKNPFPAPASPYPNEVQMKRLVEFFGMEPQWVKDTKGKSPYGFEFDF